MCIICSENKIFIDKDLVFDKALESDLKCLDVSNCSYLTSNDLEKALKRYKNIRRLECYNCPLLTFIDISFNENLHTIDCYNCKLLNSLTCSDKISRLIFINISNTKIREIDFIYFPNIKYLFCTNCRFLISLNYLPMVVAINCMNSPWIYTNIDFINNLDKLIKIQKWYKRMRIIRYLKSQEFIEWVYHPKNIGGRTHKRSLKHLFKNSENY